MLLFFFLNSDIVLCFLSRGDIGAPVIEVDAVDFATPVAPLVSINSSEEKNQAYAKDDGRYWEWNECDEAVADSFAFSKCKVWKKHEGKQDTHNEAAEVAEVIDERCKAKDNSDKNENNEDTKSLSWIIVHSPCWYEITQLKAKEAECASCRTAWNHLGDEETW